MHIQELKPNSFLLIVLLSIILSFGSLFLTSSEVNAAGKASDIVAVAKAEPDGYPTVDGTGVRDYIHVVDLARGHVKALQWMSGEIGTGEAIGQGSYQGEPQADGTRSGVGIFNLGTGKGSSVLEVIAAFEKACGKKLPYVITDRRPGDLPEYYASCDKAAKELGWVAEYDLDRMCEDIWRWQSSNPDGYGAK